MNYKEINYLYTKENQILEKVRTLLEYSNVSTDTVFTKSKLVGKCKAVLRWFIAS